SARQTCAVAKEPSPARSLFGGVPAPLPLTGQSPGTRSARSPFALVGGRRFRQSSQWTSASRDVRGDPGTALRRVDTERVESPEHHQVQGLPEDADQLRARELTVIVERVGPLFRTLRRQKFLVHARFEDEGQYVRYEGATAGTAFARQVRPPEP